MEMSVNILLYDIIVPLFSCKNMQLWVCYTGVAVFPVREYCMYIWSCTKFNVLMEIRTNMHESNQLLEIM